MRRPLIKNHVVDVLAFRHRTRLRHRSRIYPRARLRARGRLRHHDRLRHRSSVIFELDRPRDVATPAFVGVGVVARSFRSYRYHWSRCPTPLYGGLLAAHPHESGFSHRSRLRHCSSAIY